MKKFFLLNIVIFGIILTGCEITNTNGIEYIGDWTCSGQGNFGEIKGYANCDTSDGWNYNGEIWGHHFHGKGILTTSEGLIEDGYFNNGDFIAGKVTFINGNSSRGLRNESGYLELGKSFYKENGVIQLGEFANGNLIFGMSKIPNTVNGEIIMVGNFNSYNRALSNGYYNIQKGCYKVTNGNMTEITRTITNTVYKNAGINGLSRLTQPGSILNPYNVNITIK